MKTRKHQSRKAVPAAAPAPPRTGTPAWLYAAAAAAGLLLVFWAYAPALHGPFMFDDTVLPFALPGFAQPLYYWIKGVRPVLMFTYWVNARLSGDDPFSYHVVNVIIHFITSGLVFLMVRRLVDWAQLAPARRNLLAAFAAAVFLLHPVQTEAVAYLAGRSEGLSVMLAFAAFTVFLYREKTAATWPVVAAVLLLFGAALLAKEHTAVLPALFLLTDYWWNPGFGFKGIRANWKLYAPMALGAVAGVFSFRQLLFGAGTAGFAMKDLTWYQYFFTQCRGLFVYIATFLAPVNLTLDWDFPISKTVFDHGAIAGLLALVAMALLAWRYRRRFPLASYGFFVYLLLMAPTSSILPIKDPIAERRLYFSMIGLLLIAVDGLGRLKIGRNALAAGCAVMALVALGLTRARAAVWSDSVALWQDTVQKSPDKARDRFQLGFAYYTAGRGDLAIPEFEKTEQLEKGKPDAGLLLDWGLALIQLNQPDAALAKLRQAALLDPSAGAYTNIAGIYASQGRYAEALDALATAAKLDPNFAGLYLYRGKVRLKLNQPAEAVADYEHALALQPGMQEARHDLAIAQAMLRGGRR